METRAERILKVLGDSGGRLKVSEVHSRICQLENVPEGELNRSTVSATVRQDNKIQSELGKAKRFNIFGDGTEVIGYISVYLAEKQEPSKKDIINNPEIGIPRIIEEANKKVREQLRESLKKIHWRKFETNFLPQILESLGFHGIQVTQPTRDGGMDAVCQYQRGLVKSEAFVSAKHWDPKQSVPISEVQRLRGLRGHSDTAIIVTTAKFSKDAIDEAAPGQNQRSIVLIDGETIIDICLEKNLGVSEIEVPKLYNFTGFVDQESDQELSIDSE
ncbi:restriction endonuclease [Leptothrix ochracea]|uniref:restriction endonuclease n=1 Tax=Leptothrix ochracea TaxID=735331 RepID=UPI0034E27EE4